ncbi:MAG: hypothetical protein EBR40_10360 [Proteobacteria bacterium]|nr:hypothetical protein [Pseudomonadota bacterium]
MSEEIANDAKFRRAQYNRDYCRTHKDSIRKSRIAARERDPQAYLEKRRAEKRRYREKKRQLRLEELARQPVAPKRTEAEAARNRYHRNPRGRNLWHWNYQKNKRNSDPNFRAYRMVVSAMNRAAQRHKERKPVSDKCRAVVLLGCSWVDFVEHITAQFQPGMNWMNRGRTGWHFDHIKPLSAFDLTDEKQLREACHFTNVQPLWAADNVRKGAKVA